MAKSLEAVVKAIVAAPAEALAEVLAVARSRKLETDAQCRAIVALPISIVVKRALGLATLNLTTPRRVKRLPSGQEGILPNPETMLSLVNAVRVIRGHQNLGQDDLRDRDGTTFNDNRAENYMEETMDGAQFREEHQRDKAAVIVV